MHRTLTIEISRPEAVEELDKIRREASERAYVEGVFDLIRRGVISTGYGGQLLGISMDVLLDELQRHEIPVADYSGDELRSELEAALSDFDGQNPSRD